MPRTAAVLAGSAAAVGACQLAARSFVPAAPGALAARGVAPAHASQLASSAASPPEASALPAAALLGLAGAAAASAARGRTARRAEPVSAAAAGAAAAKAAAAAGAAKTAGAVAGSAGAGSLATDGGKGAGASAGTRTSWDPASQIGAQPPLGYFDPAGFTTNESTFRNLRVAEIKHGRVAMMAALGAVVQHYVQIPGFEGIPKGLGAVNASPGKEGAIALILICGGLELAVWTDDESKEPGNFGDPLGLNQYTEDMRAREINNGRFAMFAAIGIIAAELLTGKDAVEQLGF